MSMYLNKMIRLFLVLATLGGGGLFALEPVGELINIATRGKVGAEPGQELIAGFVIGGNESVDILIRGLGPELVRRGLNEEGVLVDPVLTLARSLSTTEVEVLEVNDDWVDVRGGGTSIPEHPSGIVQYLEAESKDSEIAITLEPGIYTAIVGGKGGSGIAVIEVYSLRR